MRGRDIGEGCAWCLVGIAAGIWVIAELCEPLVLRFGWFSP